VSTTDGRELHPKRQQRIEAGERVVLSLPGGGGYGDPLGRDPAQVAADAENGLVSVERARQVYGVVLKEGPGSYAPDREATDLLRTSSTTQEKSGRGGAPGGPDPCGGP
jgi:N-methylhydantoinase B